MTKLLWILLSITSANAAQAVSFQVDSTQDLRDANLADGLCQSSAGSCTLRAAVEQANALETNEVILLPPGEYMLSLTGANEDASASGDLDLRGNLAVLGSDALTTRIIGAQDRVLDIQLEAVVNLTRLTLTGGGGVNTGGGLRNAGAVVLTGCEIIGNGGDTRPVPNGAGIFNLGVLTMTGGALMDNQAQSSLPTPASGAGVYSTTGMLLSGVRIENNRALGNNASGGGVSALAPGIAQIVNSVLIGNQAAFGGGIAVTGAEFTLTGSLLAGNSASRSGAGARLQGGTLTVVDSTLSGNSAREDGGAIAVSSGGLSSYNSTFSDNLADADANNTGNGGALAQSGNGTVALMHSIVAANRDGSTSPLAPECSGAITSMGYNLLTSEQGCSFAAQASDLRNVPAQLGALADNGGASLTHALLTGSPAIDGGDPAGCFNASAQAIVLDQRGFPRPRDGNADGEARCDIGAFELQTMQDELVFASGFEQ